MPEKKIKHLEMIEVIIERMAKNSFQMERAVDRPPGKQQKSGVELGASGTEEY